MAFIDEAKFFVKAGDGGKGCVSFLREKFVPKGGPDGGDGGRGGSVIIRVSKRLHSLMDFRYRSHFIAKNGSHGLGKKKHGKKGEDFVLHVPVGSIIKDAETGEVLADLLHEDDSFIAARGGQGGGGNVHYATSRHRAPRIAGKGKPGEELWLKIELKLLADVGLVGLPNAGKSTLLSKLSAANPKVAAYPFTTLEPQLGVLQFDSFDQCIIADIPGLIEGAHEGLGLGHKFLRHIERTRILIHVIDGSGLEEDPLEQYHILEKELERYKEELVSRPRIVLLNKIDVFSSQAELDTLIEKFRSEGIDPLPVSALTGQGLDDLKDKMESILEEMIEEKDVIPEEYSKSLDTEEPL
ncbi:MAG: GTPase ObgE [Desulfobulbaceae bacterium]|uniref:GTPase Obg n=1 Tax=Candidatus Desulfobia pelagia TaxID=2841692 RepID=A0A8J6N9Z4_9BACT|nr:GTPase ObgE [Candidatus Desulfobia pelagia]